MFCSKCGTLGYYTPDGKLQCDKCKQINDSILNVTLITGETVDMNGSLTTSTEGTEINNFEVIQALKLPTTNAYICPKCEAREATCELRQMDQTDEPEVAFLKCQVCGHRWRQ